MAIRKAGTSIDFRGPLPFVHSADVSVYSRQHLPRYIALLSHLKPTFQHIIRKASVLKRDVTSFRSWLLDMIISIPFLYDYPYLHVPLHRLPTNLSEVYACSSYSRTDSEAILRGSSMVSQYEIGIVLITGTEVNESKLRDRWYRDGTKTVIVDPTFSFSSYRTESENRKKTDKFALPSRSEAVWTCSMDRSLFLRNHTYIHSSALIQDS